MRESSLYTMVLFQLLTTVDQHELSRVIRCSQRDASAIQMTCQRYIDERADTEDARALLQILTNAKELPAQGSSTDTGIKRQRNN